MNGTGKEIKLKINDNELRGQYANQIAIMHTKEDFVLDFITMYPPEAIVNTRIITNPYSLKRMYKALGINLAKYEEQYGEIVIEDDIPNNIQEKVN